MVYHFVVWFLVCNAPTQLALQLHQDRRTFILNCKPDISRPVSSLKEKIAPPKWCSRIRWTADSRLGPNRTALPQWNLHFQIHAYADTQTREEQNSIHIQKNTHFFLFLGIHTANIPSTAETHTGGGAVLGKPEGSPARRHSRSIVLK